MNTFRLWLSAALIGLVSLTGPSVSHAWAQQSKPSGPPRIVIDEVGFFSRSAKDQANQRIADIKRQFNKDLLIEAAKAPQRPKSLNAEDKAAVDRFFDQWAQKRYNELGIFGVYVVIVEEPKIIRIEVGQQTQSKGFFTTADRRDLLDRMREKLKAGDKDGALLTTVNFVSTRMREHHPNGVATSAPRAVAPAAGGQAPGHANTGFGWGTVIRIAAIALVIWLVFRIVRALFGAATGGGGGYGAAGAPGYGGGGGGFMTSLLGGMFGAAAGMWMYNNFFGHGGSSAWAGDGDRAIGGGNADNNAGDGTAADNSVGGDYGDQGGGGGDWGGGDAGGGDWGGGGGGDWGGGGGGGDW